MTKRVDYVAKRVNRVTDTVAALALFANARRTFTDDEGKRLIEALRQLDEMLRHERILL